MTPYTGIQFLKLGGRVKWRIFSRYDQSTIEQGFALTHREARRIAREVHRGIIAEYRKAHENNRSH